MRKLPASVGFGVLVAAIAVSSIACSSSDNSANLSDTPTSIALATAGATEGTTPQATAPQATAASETPAAGAVSVNLTEYIVAPKPTSIAAGSITFTAKNIGGTEHELQIIKTDLDPDTLPTKDDGSADVQGTGVEVVGAIPQFPKQEERSLTVDLQPGAYVLICNVIQQNSDGTTTSHYERGMRAAFAVQ